MEIDLIPYSAVKAIDARSVLVLAPHPDDEVFGCGGALARHVQSGCTVSVIVLSDGAFGAAPDQYEQVVAMREAESCAAALVLGYPAPTFWRLPDRDITYGEVLIGRLFEAVQTAGADLVYAPALTEMHPDHRALAMAAVEAFRRLGSGVRLAMYEVGVPLTPNLLLDITEVADLKRQAMHCFASQLKVQAYDQHIEALNRFRTYTLPADVSLAEAFCLHTSAELAQTPLKVFASEYVRQSRLGLALNGAVDVPLVSVMVRSMDRDMLGDALDAISLQTYPNIEVVVVNAKGGAHRHLGAWCGRFPLRTINENGLPLARGVAANAGLGAARGDMLAFLDDDDTLDPDHFSTLMDVIRTHLPSRVIAYSGVRGIKVRGDSHNSVQEFVEANFNPQKLLLGNFLPIHAPLFPKVLLADGVAFDETLDLYEDWDFWVQLSELAPFVFSGRITATYFMGGLSGVSPLAPDYVVTHSASMRYFDKWSKRINATRLAKISDLYLQLDARYRQKLHELNDEQAAHLQTKLALDGVQSKAHQQDNKLHELEASLENLEPLNKDLGRINECELKLSQSLAELEQRQLLICQMEQKLAASEDEVRLLKASTSWRLTRVVRLVGHQVLRAKITMKALPYAVSISGGYWGLLKHVWRTYQEEGVLGIKRRVVFSAAPGATSISVDYAQPQKRDYTDWVLQHDTLSDTDRKRVTERIDQLTNRALISVVMPVYNPPLNMLEEAILSVQGQLYPHWELCIADDASTDAGVRELLERFSAKDARIKVAFRERNGHISAASNTALALASGEFVALFDHDDLLHELALFWIADAISDHPDAGIIYSDEDKIDQSGKRFDPYFKSDWNPDLFLSHNMISHLGAYRTNLVRKLGGFRVGFEGSQDYDLALRCTQKLAKQHIVHIPRVLYHWRSHPGSTALAGSEKNYALLAGERALSDHFLRTKVAAKVELLPFGMYRTRYTLPATLPLVSLIIPTRNGLHLIKQCINSITEKTKYKNYEILIIDNNSDDPDTLDYFKSLTEVKGIRILRDERPFNYSQLNNTAAQQARGEILGLINNDIEVISPDWLDEMVSLAIQPGVGAVGARLWYPNDTLQHGGVITGVGGVANHSHKHLPKGHMGYFGRAQLIQTFSVVTAACLIVKKKIYQEVGGLDETNLKIAFNDVDFCLRVQEANYRNVWTPYAEMYHHESATRGSEDTPEKQLRFTKEVHYMQKRWGQQLLNDPAYSPNLTLDREDFSYAWPPRTEAI